MAADPVKIVKRLDVLKAARSQHESDWRDCYDMTWPQRGSGLQGDVIDSQQGRTKRAQILDSTGTDSGRILSSSLMGGLTPANSRWFALDVGNESDEERQWLDAAADTVWENIHASNFDAAGFEAMMDAVAAGWFCLFIDVDRKKGGGYSFELWPLSECYVTSTRQDGLIDTVYRKYTLTAVQAAEVFGLDNLSEKARKKVTDQPDAKLEFVRCIEPRKDYKAGARLSKNMPFASVDVECDGKHVVREQGFEEFPCAVPRWSMIPGTNYATGPAFDALPDMLELNELLRLEKAAADLAISGMWIAEDDGVLNPRTVKVGPRKIIVANSVDSMKPLNSGAQFDVSFTIKAQLQAQIRKVFMADQLQPQDGPQMTATEVHVRVGMIRQLLGPVYGRFQSEYLQPLVERCFGLAFRAGILGRPPETLQNREFHVRFISPLARAQRLEDVSAMDRLEQGILTKAQAKPELMDVYDWDEAEQLRAQYLGVPGKLMRTDDDLKAVREARVQQQQAEHAQAQQAAMQQQAMTTPEGAKLMGALAA